MRLKFIYIAILYAILFIGCKEKYTPKPRGFFRIDFPQKTYSLILKEYPYQFEIPTYSNLISDKNKDAGNYDVNIDFPKNKAKLHITYKDLMPGHTYNKELGSFEKANNFVLAKLMEESRKFVYDHTIKADAIDEKIYANDMKKVYGTIYYIKGNAASSVQFFLTDSTKHFLRGALYINEVPNRDSIKPVLDFLRPDIIHLIETTSWK